MNIRTFVLQLFNAQKQEINSELLASIEGQRERNEARIAKIKEEMGTKWILHPDHKKGRLSDPRPV